MPQDAERHLKMACELTGAEWAAHAFRDGDRWHIDYAYRLPKAKFPLISHQLSAAATPKWPRASRQSGVLAALRLRNMAAAGKSTIRAYKVDRDDALVVASTRKGKSGDGVWKLAGALLASQAAVVSSSAKVPRVDMELAYDTPRALKGVLSEFVEAARPAGAWLGIRRGEYVGVEAHFNSPRLQATSFEMAPTSLLGKMRSSRKAVLVRRSQSAWTDVPHAVGGGADYWICFPLVVGQRLVGAVTLWGDRALTPRQMRSLRALAGRLAEPVETLVTLNELTAQLKRSAMLNDFALSLSSARDLEGLAAHVVGYIRRAFRAESVELYVTSLDGRSVQEFRSLNGKADVKTVPLESHPASALLVPNAQGPENQGVLARRALPSGMTLPLKFRGQPIGALAVRSTASEVFSASDEHLLALISTHLAGLIEYGRLRAEAEERARNLEESVQQLRAAQEESGARLAAQQDAETRLVHAAKLAAVGEMAAGIAHELNNPLTTVAGFAELVLDDAAPDAGYRPDVEMILHEALRARGVVRRLLDFARQGDTSRARTDINEILEDVLALTTHFIHTSGVQLNADLGHALPWVLVDGNQMKQVFLNLVHNALQAMPGGGWLKILSERRQRDFRDWIVVEVADNGVGIDPRDLNRIFEPFFTTRGSRGGTGLGLSVTYGIVSDHGGTIEVESLPGEGAKFTVWLPV